MPVRIGGFQKLSLLDFPDRMCCTVFTEGCNFRCPFCHNASLLTAPAAEPPVSEDEVLAFLQKRRGLLDGVCVTGGEPLLQQGLEAFLQKIRALGFAVKIDTNGSFPGRLRGLIDAGLADYVAMDIKNAPEKYALTVGNPSFDLSPVRESAELLLSGVVPYEFRTTVVRGLHVPGDLTAAARFIRGARRYFLQGYRESDDVLRREGLGAFSEEEMRGFLEEARRFVPSASLRGVG